jgi:hypothetical protein
MARTLDLTSLDVTSFEIPTVQQTQAGAAMVAGGGWCCTGCDSGCGINPTAGGCESGGETYDAECTVLSAYPCDTVDICQA